MDNKQSSSNVIYQASLNVLHAVFIRTNGWWSNKVSDPLKITPLGTNASEQELWEDRTTSDTEIEHARRQY